jgi:hypothetical protein
MTKMEDIRGSLADAERMTTVPARTTMPAVPLCRLTPQPLKRNPPALSKKSGCGKLRRIVPKFLPQPYAAHAREA